MLPEGSQLIHKPASDNRITVYLPRQMKTETEGPRMNNTNITTNGTMPEDILLHSLYRYQLMDTTNDLIIGVVGLVLAILFTFACCVTLAAKCSREPRLEYQPSGDVKIRHTSTRDNNHPVTNV